MHEASVARVDGDMRHRALLRRAKEEKIARLEMSNIDRLRSRILFRGGPGHFETQFAMDVENKAAAIEAVEIRATVPIRFTDLRERANGDLIAD